MSLRFSLGVAPCNLERQNSLSPTGSLSPASTKLNYSAHGSCSWSAASLRMQRTIGLRIRSTCAHVSGFGALDYGFGFRIQGFGVYSSVLSFVGGPLDLHTCFRSPCHGAASTYPTHHPHRVAETGVNDKHRVHLLAVQVTPTFLLAMQVTHTYR